MKQIVSHVISGNQMEKKNHKFLLEIRETAARVYRVDHPIVFIVCALKTLCAHNKKMDINHKSKKSVYRHEHKKKNPV